MTDLTQNRLKEFLDYNPDTGEFIWIKTSSKRASKGRIATGAGPLGYRRIGLDGKRYQAHRLAWLWVYGELPEYRLDHRNGCRSDNRIHNLRKSTSAENARNKATGRNNTSGEPGVYWHKGGQKWGAKIVANRQQMHLGLFSDKQSAIDARRAAAQKYHGDFAAINSRAMPA